MIVSFSQSFAATGAGTATPAGVAGVNFRGRANLTLNGGASGASFKVQRSTDNGANWSDCVDAYGTVIVYVVGAAASLALALQNDAGDEKTIFRTNCTAYTAGTPATQITQ